MFKIGDKVRINCTDRMYSANDKFILNGREYRIINVCKPRYSSDEYIYRLDPDNGWCWSEKELELVKPKDELDYFKYYNYTILEFEDFDWSDFTMKKEFTKADLKNGDVVKFRGCGEYGIAIPDVNCILFKEGQLNMDLLSDDMLYGPNNNYDIMAIRRPSEYKGCSFYGFEKFKKSKTTLVYERKEVEEMTLEEVCKALGKEIKIVKK